MSNSRSPKALFLHMGPGLHSEIERRWLPEFENRVHFWNQPVHRGAKAFSGLIRSVGHEIERLYSASNSRIDIVAHCFGAQLIMAQPQRVMRQVGKIMLINPSRPLPGFHNLLTHLHREADLDEELHFEFSEFLKKNPRPKENQFNRTIEMLLRVPDLSRHYWVDPRHYKRYLVDCARERPIDLTMFGDVMAEYLQTFSCDKRTFGRTKDVTILFGAKNPFIRPNRDLTYWEGLLPNAFCQLVPGIGHHLHLEWRPFPRHLRNWLNRPE